MLLLCLIIFAPAQAQRKKNTKKTRILFVFDGSRSMKGMWQSQRKIHKARAVLYNVVDTLSKRDNIEMALRVYGHQEYYPPKHCNDSKLEVPFAKDNIGKIKATLDRIRPRGSTPIAYSLSQCINDFPKDKNSNNIIVLITDGIEECDGDICEASLELQKTGIVLKPFIIGIGRNLSETFDCAGYYFDASREEDFSRALEIVIKQALNPTSTQVNLLDENGEPNETNVNISFYNHENGVLKHNYIHTMNHLGTPDTLMINPALTYDIVVNTVPQVRRDNVKIKLGIHNIIPISCPQGDLLFKAPPALKSFDKLDCIVRKANEMETLIVLDAGQKQRLLTGKYDIELLTLPRFKKKGIEIKQNHTTSIEIPEPGFLYLNKEVYGVGSIYVVNKGELEWIYDLNREVKQESIRLLPGTYRVVFRPKHSKKSFYTIDKKFNIESGITTRLKIF